MNLTPTSSPLSHACLRILIVDDEANIRKTLSLALELDGHATYTNPGQRSD